MTLMLRATCVLWLAAGLGPASAGWAQNGNRAALLAADRAVAERSGRDGLAVGLVGALAADGALLWPGAPVARGPGAARQVLATISESIALAWQPLGLALSADSTLGLTWGVAARSARPGAAGPPALGRYLAGWRRAAGGWEPVALVFLGEAAPPAATSAGLPLELPPLAPAGSTAGFVAADLDFARLAGDSGAAVAFERWAAPDAVLPGGLLAIGPAAIGRTIGGGAAAVWRWHPVLAWASAAGDFGLTVGEATITPATGAAASSKYLTAWRRQPDGRVRFIADGGNARPGAP